MVKFSRIWREGAKRQLFWRDGGESGVYEYDSRTTTDDEAANAVREARGSLRVPVLNDEERQTIEPEQACFLGGLAVRR